MFAAFAALAGMVILRHPILSRVGRVFAFASSDDPVPLLSLERGPLEVDVQANGEIVGLDSVPVATPSTGSGALKLVWLIPEGTMVTKGTPVVRYDGTDQQLNLESQTNSLNQNLAQSMIAASDQSLEEKSADLTRESAEMDYEYAMSVLPEDETIYSKWDIISARLDAEFAKAELDNLAAKAKIQKRINRSQEQTLAIARNHVETELGIVRRTLAALEVASPSDGLVIYRQERRQDPKIGDSCQPGQVILELVKLDALKARIYVLEREAGGLSPGEPVTLELDALPDAVLHGIVQSVSPLAATLERDSTLKYFTCEVEIRDAGPSLHKIRPGMTLQARVILKAYQSCFMVPASALDVQNDKTYVYIKKGEGFEKREVELGLGKHGQGTILSGVAEMELIALKNPFETKQLKLPDFSKATAAESPRRGGPGGQMLHMMGTYGGGGRGR
jgi:multidrug efflux pump subunit AcrA (membrane-fusion protein)